MQCSQGKIENGSELRLTSFSTPDGKPAVLRSELSKVSSYPFLFFLENAKIRNLPTKATAIGVTLAYISTTATSMQNTKHVREALDNMRLLGRATTNLQQTKLANRLPPCLQRHKQDPATVDRQSHAHPGKMTRTKSMCCHVDCADVSLLNDRSLSCPRVAVASLKNALYAGGIVEVQFHGNSLWAISFGLHHDIAGDLERDLFLVMIKSNWAL